MAAINPRKRKLVDFSESTVTVIVGATRKIFTLHPSILANGSKFFRAALSGPWKESTKKSMTLPGTSAEIFQTYAAYVYSGEIDICTEPLDEASDPEARNRFLLSAELYALADVTLDEKELRNAVIDAVLDLEGKTGYQPSFEAIQYAYEHSTGTTMLCRLLLDNALAGTHPEWLKSVRGPLPEMYLQSLMFGWAQASFDKTISCQSSAEHMRCKYHEHDDEVLVDENCGSKGNPTVVKLSPKRRKAEDAKALRSRT